MLEVSGVHLWRGDRHVLKGVSLRLQPGEALQLLWPNGVGKTSLLRVVAGLLPAESGNIQWLCWINYWPSSKCNSRGVT